MEFVKSHGLGNDYLVLCSGETMTPEWVRWICNRHTGLGGDGILEPIQTDRADYGVRIWNPDGSLAEKSGNGLRIFARWLVDERNAPNQFSVWTDACFVACEVNDAWIAVEMGQAQIDSSNPIEQLDVAETTLPVVPVDLGNPHCVHFTDAPLDSLPWRTWGPRLETHQRFKNNTNVQFARIHSSSEIEIRIWERGAGETSASGSSSCAVAAAAVALGHIPSGEIVIRSPGGTLQITVADDLAVILKGPVEVVGRMHFDPRWIAARRS